MMRFVLGFVLAILVLAAVGLAIMYTGAYNVAASARRSAVEDWVLTTTMRNSVQRRAGDVAVPARITEDQVRRGFSQFRDSCVYCHGAPGVDATDWAQAIRPEPPYLPDVLPGRTPAELFWVVNAEANDARLVGL